MQAMYIGAIHIFILQFQVMLLEQVPGLTPEDSYRLAIGQKITSNTGQEVQLKRPLDHWSVGYFNYTFSDGLKDFSVPEIPGTFPGLRIGSGESGIEAFYEAQITKWINFWYRLPIHFARS